MKHAKAILFLAKQYAYQSLFSKEVLIDAHNLETDKRKVSKIIRELTDMDLISQSVKETKGYVQVKLQVKKNVLTYAEMIETEQAESGDWDCPDFKPEWLTLPLHEQLINIWRFRTCKQFQRDWFTEKTVAIFRDYKLVIPITCYSKLINNPTVEYYAIGGVRVDAVKWEFQDVDERIALPLDKKYSIGDRLFIHVTMPELIEFTTQFIFNERVESLLRPCLGWGLCKFGILKDEKDIFVIPTCSFIGQSNLDVANIESSFDDFLGKVDRIYHIVHKIESGINAIGGWKAFMKEYRIELAKMATDPDFCAKYGVV
jgi:hypothetical protein